MYVKCVDVIVHQSSSNAPATATSITMRKLLVQSAQQIALHTGVSRWLARRQHARAILTLHGVGGPDMPLAGFERLMRRLARDYRIVSLPSMIDALRVGEPPDPRGEVALTFDDGLRNQFELAYPLLRELGLCATMFVCPDLIERGAWLWNHETRARWKRLEPQGQVELARDLGSSKHDAEGLVAWMKGLSLAAREAACQCVRNATPAFRATEREHAAYDMMRWEDVVQMGPDIVTIGSHTLTHPILPSLDDAALELEFRGSRQQLETRLQRAVPLFCYPNGSMDQRVRECASRHYEAAVSTEEALVRDLRDPWNIPRIPASSNVALCAWRLHRPQA